MVSFLTSPCKLSIIASILAIIRVLSWDDNFPNFLIALGLNLT
ncbi:hypothetical protein CY0110_16322 [Crocosphaera chwakensis CCY0110]|uniref:Uncharacterized protein n=1 Tax=Crocosphaera chwakensis CCY0110 TaxID=391612 RepID=A3IHU6_9CHRO|nr:hypothetical protein CY0110_16322 [Crocosphaera chwakensis CCY0110]